MRYNRQQGYLCRTVWNALRVGVASPNKVPNAHQMHVHVYLVAQ